MRLSTTTVLKRNNAYLRFSNCAEHQDGWIEKLYDLDLLSDEEYKLWKEITNNAFETLPKAIFDPSPALLARDKKFIDHINGI
jgi:hypothetical protein